MTVREKEINFLVACLDDEESAHEIEDGHDEKTSVAESSYAKRKKREGESGRQHKLSEKKQQVELFRELMSTPDNSSRLSTSSDSVQNSLAQKNFASANEKKINVLLKVMDNAIVFAMYSVEEQNEMKNQLKRLIAEQ